MRRTSLPASLLPERREHVTEHIILANVTECILELSKSEIFALVALA